VFTPDLKINLDDAQAELCSREFDHRLAHDGFQAGAKPTGGAFQQRNDGTGVLALPTKQGAQGSQQFRQIVHRSNATLEPTPTGKPFQLRAGPLRRSDFLLSA